MKRMRGYELSISAAEDGSVEALYISVHRTKIVRTVELIPGKLLADYSQAGDLVGLEVIGPVKLSVLTKKVPLENREPIQALLRNGAGPLIHA